jgi:2-polyprenyl-3-methyl-5-hydroxy-6-metoxy-1,4-benzoquinol methylase
MKLGPPHQSRISEFLAAWLNNDLLAPQEQKTLRQYYSSYSRSFSERIRAHYDRQTLEIMRLITAAASPSVLEVGCGCGTESLWMALHGACVEAIDVKEDRLTVARARKAYLEDANQSAIECRFERISVLDLPRGSNFDLVWMEQAFHHLEPRAEVLDRLSELVSPGGFIVISEANALNPLLQALLFTKRGLSTIKTYQDHAGNAHPYGDERITTAFALRRHLSLRHITPISAEHFRVFPNQPMFDRLGWIEKIIPQWLSPAFTHFNIVGHRKGSGVFDASNGQSPELD